MRDRRKVIDFMEDYEAACDGATDVTEKLQAALDESARTGARILLRGTAKITKTLRK